MPQPYSKKFKGLSLYGIYSGLSHAQVINMWKMGLLRWFGRIHQLHQCVHAFQVSVLCSGWYFFNKDDSGRIAIA